MGRSTHLGTIYSAIKKRFYKSVEPQTSQVSGANFNGQGFVEQSCQWAS